MKIIALCFIIIVFAITVVVVCLELSLKVPNILNIGNFIVLSFTLMVLVWYAYDTNSIARVTRERWMRDGVLSTTYSMEVVGKRGELGRTLFRIHNQSTLIVRARVRCNFRLYGDPIESYPIYDGTDIWLLFPQQITQGWFEIESLLQKNGKNVAALIAELTPDNRESQLTMMLELEFWDELGEHRNFPARPHHFDFEQWAWIPRIAETPRQS